MGTTFWIFVGLAAFFCVLVAVIFYLVWVGVRNTPTLRSRRFLTYEVFWMLQYLILFIIVYAWCSTATVKWLVLQGVNDIVVNAVIPTCLLIAILGLLNPKDRLKKIIENDLGLPGQRIESYSYPQVERRFLLSLLTNLLLTIALHVSFVGNVLIFSKDAAALSFLFFAQIVGSMTAIALATALYYLLGRSLLEICRTKQNFLSAPPLIDNPFEVILVKICKHPNKETLFREAIAQFDPVTMTEDEPEVTARHFPRHWLWIGGFYAVFMVGMFCLAAIFPNSYAPREMLKRTGIIHDYTVPGDFVPWNPERYYRRGIRVANDDPHKAIADFSLAIRLNPKNQEYFERRANVYATLGNLDAAEKDLTEVIRLQPDSRSYQDRASFFEHTKKDLQAALADSTTAIECAEQEKIQYGYSKVPPQWLYSARAKLYEQLNEPEKAAADWAKVRE